MRTSGSKVSAWAYFAFQSTLPAREATLTPLSAAAIHGFQSTLPAREATLRHTFATLLLSISIHASREGSDERASLHFLTSCPFQSTLPAREATKGDFENFLNFFYFNPRFPRGKRLCAICGKPLDSANFNPRFPRGKRLNYPFFRMPAGDFNPRFPRGKRLQNTDTQITISNFNPRFPRGKRPLR